MSQEELIWHATVDKQSAISIQSYIVTASDEAIKKINRIVSNYSHELERSKLGSYLIQATMQISQDSLDRLNSYSDHYLVSLMSNEHAGRVLLSAANLSESFKQRFADLILNQWLAATSTINGSMLVCELIQSRLIKDCFDQLLTRILDKKSKVHDSRYQKKILVALLQSDARPEAVKRVWEQVI